MLGSLNPALQKPYGFQPAPFVKWRDFLSTLEFQETLNYMFDHQAAFSPALVGSVHKGGYAPEIRNNIDLKEKHPIKPVFRKKINSRLNNIGQETFR